MRTQTDFYQSFLQQYPERPPATVKAHARHARRVERWAVYHDLDALCIKQSARPGKTDRFGYACWQERHSNVTACAFFSGPRDSLTATVVIYDRHGDDVLHTTSAGDIDFDQADNDYLIRTLFKLRCEALTASSTQ